MIRSLISDFSFHYMLAVYCTRFFILYNYSTLCLLHFGTNQHTWRFKDSKTMQIKHFKKCFFQH